MKYTKIVLRGSSNNLIKSNLGFFIGIPLRGIARNGRFRLHYFSARNCAIIAKNEAIKYTRNWVELRGIAHNCVHRNCFSI